VHRAVYIGTSALAIVHAHPPSAVTLSLLDTRIELPGNAVVVGTSAGIVAGVLADEIARELKKRPLVVVKGHGSFAVGRTLKEACELTIKFETECARLCRLRSLVVKERQE
jgi:L-fuculose-phosphate aldolase